jgi:ferredoxin
MQYFINRQNLSRFLLKVLSARSLFALKEKSADYEWAKFSTDTVEHVVTGRYRAAIPPKMFFFPPSEVLDSPEPFPSAVLGVKSCDIRLLHTSDGIFLGGSAEDDFYKRKRADTLLISADCTDCKDTCFCVKMGLNPWPEKNFDINLSPIAEGFVVECGSNIGEDLVRQSPNLFQKAIDQQTREKEKNRRAVAEKVAAQNSRFDWREPSEIVAASENSTLWKDGSISKTCVECDGCRWVCGSCYCFLLGETQGFWDKTRTWDSCQSAGYARVAGGSNPRREKYQRLRNYYMCKLVYRPKNFGLLACSGCGRCIEVCPGKIDIRESLQKLSGAIPRK